MKIQGTWTAIITPFTEDGSEIDYQAMEGLVERQIEGGVTGILVIGTTGESPSLDKKESVELIKKTKKMIGGRCLLMAGSGTNNTKKTIKKTKAADKAGADVIMLVNPYYNKPTQKGLYRHFKKSAESTDKPVIVYNIKSRTGVNVETDTLMRLIENVDNIIGVKEASGNIDQIQEVCRKSPDEFTVLSGDDGLTYLTIEAGGDGVVSVASNLVPGKVSEMVNAGLEGDLKKAKNKNEELENLFKDIFLETNPIPVKFIASEMGLCNPVYRLPMCPPSEKTKKRLKKTMKEYNLN